MKFQLRKHYGLLYCLVMRFLIWSIGLTGSQILGRIYNSLVPGYKRIFKAVTGKDSEIVGFRYGKISSQTHHSDGRR